MFTPENPLEWSLMQAANDPAHRPQFYRDFVAADILVVSHGPSPPAEGETAIPPGTKLMFQDIEMGGKRYLPIFSSLSRLQSAIRGEARYLSLNAQEFLKLTRGAEVMLNPGCEYGKEFTREEIEAVLDGTIGKPTQVFRTEQETQVLLGQPQRYPQALADALSRLFRTLPDVECAYLAHFHNPAQGDPSHTLIALSAKGDWDAIVAQVGVVVQGVDVPDPPVDFVRLDGTRGFADYFAKVKPFYKRPVFGLSKGAVR